MTEENFRTFQHYKSQKIMTYSSIVYGLLTRIYRMSPQKLSILNCLCPLASRSQPGIIHIKKLMWQELTNYRKETVRLLREEVLAKCNWKTIFCRHYKSIFNHCDVIGLQSYQIRCKWRKIRRITPYKVNQGHRCRYQSKARMRLPISN